MPWPFRRRKNDDMDVDTLLARAEVASPPAVAVVAGSFRLPVEDVFAIRGRGTVVTGRVESGTVTLGMPVTIQRGEQPVRTVKVTGIEQFRKTLDSATVGANVGLLLAGVEREDVLRGDLLLG